MVKDPKRRRLRRFHKVSDNRTDIIKSGEPSANNDVTSAGSDLAKLPVTAPFKGYTNDERKKIAAELVRGADNFQGVIDEIELLVRQTVRSQGYRISHPIPKDMQGDFRDLLKPIGKIVSVLNNPSFGHLHEVLPNLRSELVALEAMVEADQRKGPGRPRDPGKKALRDLIRRLADIWRTGRKSARIKRRFNDLTGRDEGPFYRFLRLCLDPAGLEPTDHDIRVVIGQS